MLNRGGSDALPRARALSRAAALACGGLHGWPPLRRRFLPALSRPSRLRPLVAFAARRRPWLFSLRCSCFAAASCSGSASITAGAG